MAEYTSGGGGGEQEQHADEHEEGGADVISVTTALLVDDAVTSAKIAAGAVGETQLDGTYPDGSVGTADLAFDTATQTELDNHATPSDAHHTYPVPTGGIVDDAVTSAKIATDAVGSTQIDLAANYIWTGEQIWGNRATFRRDEPSSGQNQLASFADSTSSESVIWNVSSLGDIILTWDSSASAGTYLTLPTDGSEATWSERVVTSAGQTTEFGLDFGATPSFRVIYQSGDDALAIRDQENNTDRAQFDRTTGDLSIEGTLTEGATL